MKRIFDSSVFYGKDAVKDYLNPKNHPATPLIELPDSLNPLADCKVRIFAKLANGFPLFNVKWYPSISMCNHAKNHGRFEGVHTLVVGSSGNTAFSLTILAQFFGKLKVKVIVPKDIAPGKLAMLLLAGAEPEFTTESVILKAKEYENKEGYLVIDQYSDQANPFGIADYLASQLWEQTRGEIGIVAVALGTCGNYGGIKNLLEIKGSCAVTLGVNLLPNNAVPGARTLETLKQVELFTKRLIEPRIEIGAKSAYKKCLQSCRAGVIGGPTSGLALEGLIAYLQFQKEHGTLHLLRDQDDEVIAIVVYPDLPFIYYEKFGTILDPVDF